MTPHIFQKTIIIKKNIKEVFHFFSNAANLNKLTPQKLGFKMLTPSPVKMKTGTILDYKIKLNGISFLWRSEITKWDPPNVFEDTQLKGPYKVWIHEHRFVDKGDSTVMT